MYAHSDIPSGLEKHPAPNQHRIVIPRNCRLGLLYGDGTKVMPAGRKMRL